MPDRNLASLASSGVPGEIVTGQTRVKMQLDAMTDYAGHRFKAVKATVCGLFQLQLFVTDHWISHCETIKTREPIFPPN